MRKRLPTIIMALLLAVSGCNLLGTQPESECGYISARFLAGTHEVITKAGTVVSIDTNSFILSVRNSSGDILYEGKWCEAPLSLPVSPGTYYIKVESQTFTKPAFDSPVWGDEQCVKVVSGTTASVTLLCRQINTGVRLSIAKEFLTACSGSSLLLKSSEGSLLYSYNEKRTAYFNPGEISLVMSTGSEDETLLKRSLCAGEILALKLEVATSSSSGSDSGGSSAGSGDSFRIKMQVDTSRIYLNETYVIGEDSSSGADIAHAFTIAQVRSNVGKEKVWIGGYIVGGDLTSKGISFEEPFASNTNIALGPRSNTSSRADCISVQLQSGEVRDEINLKDNPDVLHRYVYLKGDIVAAYYGLVGIKNVTDYKFK